MDVMVLLRLETTGKLEKELVKGKRFSADTETE